MEVLAFQKKNHFSNMKYSLIQQLHWNIMSRDSPMRDTSYHNYIKHSKP